MLIACIITVQIKLRSVRAEKAAGMTSQSFCEILNTPEVLCLGALWRSGLQELGKHQSEIPRDLLLTFTYLINDMGQGQTMIH